MIRPDWDEFVKHHWKQLYFKGACIECSCGQEIQNMLIIKQHWEVGHFDTPQNMRSVEEIRQAIKSLEVDIERIGNHYYTPSAAKEASICVNTYRGRINTLKWVLLERTTWL